jgi:integrase
MKAALRAVAPAEPVFEPWVGGRKRTVGGVTTYYVRKWLGSVRKEFSLGSDEGAALAELALFNRDPAGYRTPRERATTVHHAQAARGVVRLDATTLEAFFERCERLVEQQKMSRSHLDGTLKPYLKQWAIALEGADLHAITLDTVQDRLAAKAWATAQHKRIVAFKSFTKWARTEKKAPKLRGAEDPTRDLITPKITRKRDSQKDYEIPFVERLYRTVDDLTARDVVRLRTCAHGMHETEIKRLARGDAELRRVSDPSGIEGVLKFWHEKKDDWHVVPVDAATFAAAERLQARGKTVHLRSHMYAARIKLHGCEGVVKEWKRKGKRKGVRNGVGFDRRVLPCPKCPKFKPSHLRHSFATWALRQGKKVFPLNQEGVDLESISIAMGHLNKKTTKGHYIGDHVPPMITVPALRLEHPDDPKV